MSNTTNFYVKQANGTYVDIITLYDRTAPGTQTTNFITNGTGYTNKDLGQIFTPYIYGANSINFFTGTTTDLGSKFAQIGKTIKYEVSGTYTTTSGGGYNTIIIFTGNGTIKFNSGDITARTLLVGGGGNGGNGAYQSRDWAGGGGGGGGVGIGNLTFTQLATYTITVGLSVNPNLKDSSITGTSVNETAYAGGNGLSFNYAFNNWGPPNSISRVSTAIVTYSYINPGNGGCGGGGAFTGKLSFSNVAGRNGENSPVIGGGGSGGYGKLTYSGRAGGDPPTNTNAVLGGSCGGGGAGATGGSYVFDRNDSPQRSPGTLWRSGNGGTGVYFDLTNAYYGGGGGGGYSAYGSGVGGNGGGGNGSIGLHSSTQATKKNGSNGAANTGGGGGGGAGNGDLTWMTGANGETKFDTTGKGGTGGSGICVIAFNI